MGGWDLPAFNELFYPVPLRKGFRKLQFFSQFFDLVELNATFYNTSFSTIQVRRWVGDVSANKNFVFTVKLFKGFTHSRDATKGDLLNMKNLLDVFAASERLGGLVMQFHHSFRNTPAQLDHVITLCKEFAPYRPFVEVRHASWNDPATLEALRQNSGHLVNVDLPQIPGHMPLTSIAWRDVAYFRLMGRNARAWNSARGFDSVGASESGRYNYFYTQQELQDLAARIRSLSQSSARVFVVFHNDPNANSLVNGFQLRRILNPAERLVAPKHFLKKFPILEHSTVATFTEQSFFDQE